MIQVKDGSRVIQFEGELIGSSSSWRRGAERWVEFQLYRTKDRGIYVLSRIGVSTLFHEPDCDIVRRNNLRETPRSELNPHATPCPECRPDMSTFPIVCPERERHWAQICETPRSVFEALVKYDTSGSQYLTFVAKRLLEAASDKDSRISDVYLVQTIE